MSQTDRRRRTDALPWAGSPEPEVLAARRPAVLRLVHGCVATALGMTLSLALLLFLVLCSLAQTGGGEA
jgi:hypothetical protein